MATASQKGGIALEQLRTVGLEIWGKGRTELIDEVYADDFVVHDGTDTYSDEASMRAWIESYRTAMPDMRAEFTELFGTDEFACGVYRMRGTNTGPLPEMDIEPTGKEVDVTGLAIVHCEDGKIVEEWGMGDEVEMMTQLGLMESPAA